MNLRRILAVLLICVVATACTGTPPAAGPRFDDEITNGVVAELSCMKHQPEAPGTRYTDDTLRRTDDTLAVFRYYTANGGKPYCDGHILTAVDRQWVDLYVRLGADKENVAALLGK